MQVFSDLPALLDSQRPESVSLVHDDREVTFGELAEQSRRLASGLLALGVRPGDRIGIWLPNVPEWLSLFFACTRIGAIAVAVNTRFRTAEIEDIVGRSGCRFLVMWPGFKNIDFAGILAAADPQALAGLEQVIVLGDPAAAPEIDWPVVPLKRLLESEPLAATLAGPRDPALVFTTSGTTAMPKFVLHRQEGIVKHACHVAAAHGYVAADSVLLQVLPFCGAFGHAQIMGTLAAGRPAIADTVFDAERAAEAISRHRVTHFNASDEMISAIVAAQNGRSFETLRAVGYARFSGAAGLLESAEQAGIPLVGLFGMSETHALFARQDPEDAENRLKPGGIPVIPEARVRVVSAETGEPVAPGETGFLEISSPTLFAKYLGNPEATKEAFTADGFFRTGDLAIAAPGGGFIYEGRSGDTLRLGGFLVAPQEIEAVLDRHPSVAASAVIAGGGAFAGKAVAFVETGAGQPAREADLQNFCGASLARFKVPARIVVMPELPRVKSPNGAKLDRVALRKLGQGLD